MVDQFKMLKTTHENLLKHLVEVEESKEDILERLFPYDSPERDNLKKLFERYIDKLDAFLRRAIISEDIPRKYYVFLPFVIIGSEVLVKDLKTEKNTAYRIVSPFACAPSRNDASYLSPIGQSFMLKEEGEQVVLNTPDGTFHYEIKSVRYPEQSSRHLYSLLMN